jgi:hypothetical protein
MMLKLMTFVRPIRHLPPPEVTRRQVIMDVVPVVLACAFNRRLELGGERAGVARAALNSEERAGVALAQGPGD